MQATAEVYQFTADSKKVRAQELIDDILAKRDELAQLLGLDRIDIDLHVHDHMNSECNLTETAYILGQSAPKERLASHMVKSGDWNTVIGCWDKALDIYIFGVKKKNTHRDYTKE